MADVMEELKAKVDEGVAAVSSLSDKVERILGEMRAEIEEARATAEAARKTAMEALSSTGKHAQLIYDQTQLGIDHAKRLVAVETVVQGMPTKADLAANTAAVTENTVITKQAVDLLKPIISNPHLRRLGAILVIIATGIAGAYALKNGYVVRLGP